MTRTAKIAAGLTAMALTMLVTTGCTRSTGPDTAGPTDTPAPTVSPSLSPTPDSSPSPTPPATDPAIVFAADGIGAYIIGTGLSDLSARSLLTKIVESPTCENAASAEGTGRYSGKLTLAFRDGRLVSVHTRSTDWITPSGAKVGMTLTELQDIYGSRGVLLTGNLGNQAFSVRVPATALAIVFHLDLATKTKVDSMAGGEAQALEDAVKFGEGC